MERESDTIEITPIGREEGVQILDRAAWRLLNMSGDEFVRRWEHGDTENMDHVAAMKVAMLIPLAR